jgi:fructose-1,6-bisphosphatase/inositol monophosphatase family enzyme
VSGIDTPSLAAALKEAAIGEIMPRFRRLDDSMVRQKTEAIDLVTEADEAAERHIQRAVTALAPDALFVGEESVAADPALLGRLAASPFAIVVDPIDGTANYAAGVPLFGVMAAVVQGGETIAGIIYDPMGDDWVIAEKGSGAWHVFPDGGRRRLSFASSVPLDQMVGMASVGYLPDAVRPVVLANLAKVRMAACYRCAAHEYRMAASGHLHFIMFNKLMPWDHLAGALICEEAGAHVARFDGSAYRPEHVSGGLIIAPDPESWTLLRREIFTV